MRRQGDADPPGTFQHAEGIQVQHVVRSRTTPVDQSSPRHYLVTRPCYLALRRALASHCRPHGVVVLLEPERSLTRTDIEDVLGVRVVATMAVQPATARLIDAGLLATQRRGRLPLVWVD